jgi:hypothetical protein
MTFGVTGNADRRDAIQLENASLNQLQGVGNRSGRLGRVASKVASATVIKAMLRSLLSFRAIAGTPVDETRTLPIRMVQLIERWSHPYVVIRIEDGILHPQIYANAHGVNCASEIALGAAQNTRPIRISPLNLGSHRRPAA